MALGPADFDALARSLTAITDQALRVSYVRHGLLNGGPEHAAALFVLAMDNSRTVRGIHGELLQTLSLALADEACDALRDQVRALLETGERPELGLMLKRDVADEDPDTQRVPDFGKGRHVSLGERKSLARCQDRELIARCLRDPHPTVVRILLANPIVTETDVVRMCARRPASTVVLREVFRSCRWMIRYQVKLALALNPYTPLDVALQLAPFLQAQDARRLLASHDLRDELRSAVQARMPARSQPPRS